MVTSDRPRSHKIGQIASHRSRAVAKIPCGLPDRKLQSLWLRTLPGPARGARARQQRQWDTCGDTEIKLRL